MEAQLYGELEAAARRGIAVKDIAFSGNGEPTLSPDFFRALKVAARIRDEAAKEAALVLITNGTGLLERATFQALRQAACGPAALHIWLKLDAGTEAWYTRMAASPVPWARLIPAMTAFTGCAPVTIQTMLCAIQGRPPPPEEAAAWERLVVTLAETGAAAAWAPGQARPGVTAVQLYGKARPAPRDPWTTALAPAYLEARAAALKAALAAALVCTAPISIQVFP
jgi:histidinol dehydrogenase